MNIRIKPKIYLFIGYVSWFFFSLFYTTIYFTSQSFHGTLNGTFYLFLLGIFPTLIISAVFLFANNILKAGTT